MRKKILIALVVMLALYLGAAWYFAGEITAFQVKTFDDVLKEDHITGYSDVGLPRPVEARVKSDDIEISGWLFLNPRPENCGVVMHHGHVSNRMGNLKFARLFWRRGCHILTFDARHHGESGGAYGTWGFKEKNDLVNVVNWFMEKTGLRPEQTGIYGSSMGASIVLQAAPLLPNLAFAAVDSPFRDLKSILIFRGVASYGKPLLVLYPAAAFFAGLRGGFHVDEVSPLLSARNITIPVFIVHNQDDDAIPYVYSQEIFDAIPGKNKILHLPEKGGGHCKLIDTDPVLYEKWIDEFLTAYAPGFK